MGLEFNLCALGKVCMKVSQPPKKICNVTSKGFPLFLNNIEKDLQKLLFFPCLLLHPCSKKKSIISEEIIYTEKSPGLDLILIAKFPGYLVMAFQWRDKGGICSTGKAQGMCCGCDM